MTSWKNTSNGTSWRRNSVKKGGLHRLKLNLPAFKWINDEMVPMFSFTEEIQENFAEVVSIKLVKKFLETSVTQ